MGGITPEHGKLEPGIGAIGIIINNNIKNTTITTKSFLKLATKTGTNTIDSNIKAKNTAIL